MLSFGLLDIAIIAALSVGGAGLLFLILQAIYGKPKEPAPVASADAQATVFLFDDEYLADATPDARSLIEGANPKMTDRQAIIFVLGQQFPDLEEAFHVLGRSETRELGAADGSSLRLQLKEINGLIRLSLMSEAANAGAAGPDHTPRQALASELSFLRNLSDKSPTLIWQQGKTGNLTWANRAYLQFSDSLEEGGLATDNWPEQAIFPNLHPEALDQPDGTAKRRRLSVTMPNKRAESWFDVTSVRDGDKTLHFAADANAAIAAEQGKRKVVQTLTKIFAHLSVGLAIFDHKRQLSIFNPALLDLTHMSPDFLSGRPTLDMFLDALREAQMLPEPKNYGSWKDQFKALEAAARDGTYSENWSLPSGLTYRVTGRPHPDGAFAFFFEDISAEVSLTRRFRTDIETGQSVLDTLPDAIAVFSGNGTLVMSNKAYSGLWGLENDDIMESQDIRGELRVWQSQCAASPIWSELRAFVGSIGDRTDWTDTAILDDGRPLTCQAKPIAGGMTMVTFRLTHSAAPLAGKSTGASSGQHGLRSAKA